MMSLRVNNLAYCQLAEICGQPRLYSERGGSRPGPASTLARTPRFSRNAVAFDCPRSSGR